MYICLVLDCLRIGGPLCRLLLLWSFSLEDRDCWNAVDFFQIFKNLRYFLELWEERHWLHLDLLSLGSKLLNILALRYFIILLILEVCAERVSFETLHRIFLGFNRLRLGC